jgi:hypothetical protein
LYVTNNHFLENISRPQYTNQISHLKKLSYDAQLLKC